MLAATPRGRRTTTRWLSEPVAHVRDARSLLMLKLLFLSRREADLRPLLTAQHELLVRQAARLTEQAERATGFERVLLLWRVESTSAALRFVETMLAEPARIG